MIYGYARVSSKDQNEARQMVALQKFGCDKIFLDKQSGKDFDRAAWQTIRRIISPGDLLVVESIDRLGRNYEEIQDQWRAVTKTIGADIVVLDMPLLDTRPGKDLTGSLIADIVLSLLSYVAQTEREAIRKRQAEGIAAAKARGQKFGRPTIKRLSDYFQIVAKYEKGEISAEEGADHMGVSLSTFYRWVKKIKEEKEWQESQRMRL